MYVSHTFYCQLFPYRLKINVCIFKKQTTVWHKEIQDSCHLLFRYANCCKKYYNVTCDTVTHDVWLCGGTLLWMVSDSILAEIVLMSVVFHQRTGISQSLTRHPASGYSTCSCKEEYVNMRQDLLKFHFMCNFTSEIKGWDWRWSSILM